MIELNRKCVFSLALGAALLPSAALAGTPSPIVVVGPPGGAGAASAANAVPALSNGLLLALAVLLAVVAIRFVRQKGVQQKVMSLLLLGGGLILGTLGVQDTKATNVTVSVESSACTGATVSISPSRGDGFSDSGEFYNSCAEASVMIVSYQGYPCSAGAMIHTDLPPGTVVPAGASNLTLSYCPLPPPT